VTSRHSKWSKGGSECGGFGGRRGAVGYRPHWTLGHKPGLSSYHLLHSCYIYHHHPGFSCRHVCSHPALHLLLVCLQSPHTPTLPCFIYYGARSRLLGEGVLSRLYLRLRYTLLFGLYLLFGLGLLVCLSSVTFSLCCSFPPLFSFYGYWL